MKRTRTGLQIVGGLTLREYLEKQNRLDPVHHTAENDPGIKHVESLAGRMVITMTQDEQEHVKRYLMGLIVEEELIQEHPKILTHERI